MSSACVPAVPRSGPLLTTQRTRSLLEARSTAVSNDVLETPYHRSFSLGILQIELFPSGHLPGAASLQLQVGAQRVVYAGDIYPARPGEPARMAETCETRPADILVLGAPVAALGRLLPPRALAHAQLLDAVERAFTDRLQPIVLAATFGAAQEVIALLGGAGFGVSAHARIAAIAHAYRQLGFALPPLIKPAQAQHSVLVWPIERRRAAVIARHPSARRIAVSGLALLPDAAARLGVDEAIALSEHGDLDAVVGYVRATGAHQVFLTTGYSPVLAGALQALNVQVHRLGPPEQIALPWREEDPSA